MSGRGTSGCLENTEPADPSFPPPCMDDNLDVPTERVEESQESVRRESLQFAAHKIGHVGLVDPQELGGLRLI